MVTFGFCPYKPCQHVSQPHSCKVSKFDLGQIPSWSVFIIFNKSLLKFSQNGETVLFYILVNVRSNKSLFLCIGSLQVRSPNLCTEIRDLALNNT